jgi:excisionase family DNA binding protein
VETARGDRLAAVAKRRIGECAIDRYRPAGRYARAGRYRYAAERLSTGRRFVRHPLTEQRIPYHQLGKNVLIANDDLAVAERLTTR